MQKKPVIGGNIPAVSELITPGKDGEVVGEAAGDLAKTILLFINNPEKARRMGEAGFQKVRDKYNWKTIKAGNQAGKKVEKD